MEEPEPDSTMPMAGTYLFLEHRSRVTDENRAIEWMINRRLNSPRPFLTKKR